MIAHCLKKIGSEQSLHYVENAIGHDLQRGAKRVARVVLGAHAFQASLDGAAVGDAVLAEGAPGPDAVGAAVGAVPTALRMGSRGDNTEDDIGVADGALLVVRSLRADNGVVVVFGRGVVGLVVA